MTHNAIVRDLSMGGIAVILNAAPPAEGPIWVGLDDESCRIDRVQARLISTASLDASTFRVGLAWSGRV